MTKHTDSSQNEIPDVDVHMYAVSRYPKPSKVIPIEDLSVACDANSLRMLSSFFAAAADQMEQVETGSKNGWHMHLQDWLDGWDSNMVDVIVCIPE